MDNKSISHTSWKCQYHIVFIPKYRKKTIIWKNQGRCQNNNNHIMQV